MSFLAPLCLSLLLRGLETRRIGADFLGDAETANLSIQQEIHGWLHELHELRMLIASAESLTRQEFRRLASAYLLEHETNTGLQALAWHRFVAAADRSALEAELSRAGLTPPQLTELDPNGNLVRAPERPEYVITEFNEPREKNRRVLDYDVDSEPTRHAALDRARATGEPTATSLIRLIEGHQPGFIVFCPVYREAKLLGFVSGVFRFQELVSGALIGKELNTLDVFLLDQGDPGRERLLFRHSAHGQERQDIAASELNAASLERGLHHAQSFDVAARAWRFIATPPPSYAASRRTWIPWFALVAGFILARAISSYARERRRNRKELERSEQNLHYAQAVSQTGSWYLDLRSNVLEWSPETYRLLRVPQTVPPSLQAFEERIHPEDLERVRSAWAAALRGEAYDVEHRLRFDGEIRWVRERAEVRFDRKGNAVFGIGTVQDITEHRNIEEEYRKSQSLLRTVIDSTEDWIFIKDLEHRYRLVNQGYARALGLTPEQMLGKNELELGFTPDVVRGNPEAGIRGFWADDLEVLGSGMPKSIPDELAVFGPKTMRLSTLKVPMKDEEGTVWGVLGFVHDITELKDTEQRLRAAEQFAQTTLDSLDAHLCVVDQNGKILAVNQAWRQFGASNPPTPRNDCVGANYLEACDRASDPYAGEASSFAEGIRAVLQGRLESFSMEYPCPSPSERQWFLGKVSPFFGGNGRMAVITHQNITTRRLADLALRESEHKFRSFFDALEDLVFVLDMQGHILATNKAVPRRLGYAPEELAGLDAMLLHPPELRDEARRTLSSLMEGAYDICSLPLADKSGRCLPVETRVFRGQWNGQAVIFGVSKDLSALKASEEKFAKAFQASPLLMGLTELETGKFLEVNHAFLKLHGYTREEVIGRTPPELNLLMDPGKTQEIQRQLLERGSVQNLELQLRSRTGELRYGLFTAESMKLQSRDVVLIGVHEITDRKLAEEALRRSEEGYRSLFENMLEGYAHCQMLYERGQAQDYIHLSVNRAFERLTGLRDALGKRITELVPGIREANSGLFEAYDRVIRTGRPEKLEVYVPGLNRWFAVSVYSPEQEQFVVVFDNITERKRAEADLLKQVARMEALARLSQSFVATTTSVQDVLDTAAREVSGLFGDPCALWLVSQDGQSLEPGALFHPDPGVLERLRELQPQAAEFIQRTGPTQLLQTDQTLLIRQMDAAAPPHASPLIQAYDELFGSHGVAAVRLRSQEKTFGILGLLRSHSKPPYSAEDANFLRELANHAALALSNARLLEQARRHAQELERRVVERTAELSEANTALTRALRTKDEFLANMSHELRTPLSGILALSEALAEQTRGPLNERQLKSVHSIEASGKHLLSLINDILDLSKIEAGRVELQLETVFVEEVCQVSLLFIKEIAAKKKLRVEYHCNDHAASLLADPRRLKQMLVNLLSNAVKFTATGGVSLEVEADPQRRLIRFSVQDTGIGIAPQDIDKLFHPFTQLDSSLARAHEGTGLGLALVQRLARLHGGEVQVESAGVPGQGSKLTITLPWIPARAAEPSPRQAPSQSTLRPSAPLPPAEPNTKARILLAEDNETSGQAIGDYLQYLGYRVSLARNGLEAVEQALKTKPELILMDIQMPLLDGLEATRRLRATSGFEKLPIVALTALAMPTDREHCLRAGATDYLSKPVALKELRILIENLLKKAET